MENIEQEVNPKTFNAEEFAQKLIDMANNFVAKDFKKNALKELDDLEAKGIHIPYSAYIVHAYPDFNHIELKITQPDVFVFKMSVNPQTIKDYPDTALQLALMYQGFMDMGAKEEIPSGDLPNDDLPF